MNMVSEFTDTFMENDALPFVQRQDLDTVLVYVPPCRSLIGRYGWRSVISQLYQQMVHLLAMLPVLTARVARSLHRLDTE